jgi:hypothetical protein
MFQIFGHKTPNKEEAAQKILFYNSLRNIFKSRIPDSLPTLKITITVP